MHQPDVAIMMYFFSLFAVPMGSHYAGKTYELSGGD
jgi:hypothetical protein